MDKDLASGELVGTQTPEHLFAGDAQIVTEEGNTVVAGANLAKYTVVGRITASGKLTKHNPAAADGSQVAIGVLCQAAAAAAADVAGVPIYTAGFFNHEMLVWDAALATLAQRQAAMRAGSGHQIRIGSVRL